MTLILTRNFNIVKVSVTVARSVIVKVKFLMIISHVIFLLRFFVNNTTTETIKKGKI